MAGAVLILLAAFSPWALLRLMPLAELASGAAGTFRRELGRASRRRRCRARGGWSGARSPRPRCGAMRRAGGCRPGTAGALDPDAADGPDGWLPRGRPMTRRGDPARTVGAARANRRATLESVRTTRRSPAPTRCSSSAANIARDPAPGRTRTRRDRRTTHLPVRSARAPGPPRAAPRAGRQPRWRPERQLAILVLDRAPTAAGAFLGDAVASAARRADRVRAGRPPHRRGVGAGRARVRHCGSCAAGSAFRSRAPAGGMLATERRRAVASAAPPSGTDAPRRVRGVRILDAPYRDRLDRRPREREAAGSRRYSRAACSRSRCSTPKPRSGGWRAGAWCSSGAAARPIRRIQWIERTAPRRATSSRAGSTTSAIRPSRCAARR